MPNWKNLRKKMAEWRSGGVLCYAFRLNLRRKLRYGRNPEKNEKVYNLDMQNVRTRIIWKLQKRYLERMRKIKAEIEKKDASLPHVRSNKIFILWWQGMAQAPALVRVCAQSVVDRLGDRYEIVLLDRDNYRTYAPLPADIEEKLASGKLSLQAFSDLLRLELLARHGGIWMDATMFCTDGNLPAFMLEDDFFCFQTLWPATWGGASRFENWFLSAKSNQKLVLFLRDVLLLYFRTNKVVCDYLLTYDLMEAALPLWREEWDGIAPVGNGGVHILQERLLRKFDEETFGKILSQNKLHKLNWRLAEEGEKAEGSYYRYLLEHYPLYEG